MSPKPEQAPTNHEKTPAEIAATLEQNALSLDTEGKKVDAVRKRELAKKVRRLHTVVDLRQLITKLPELEKNDIREAQSVVATEAPLVTTKTIATTAGLSAVAATIATKVNSMPDQLGIKDSIKEWLKETLMEAPDPEDGIFGKLIYGLEHMFLTPLALALGIDLSKEEKKEEQKEEEIGKWGEMKKERTSEEKIKDIGMDVAFNNGARAMVHFFPERADYKGMAVSNAPTVLAMIQNRHYTEIKQIYEANKENNKELATKLGLPDTDPVTVELAVRALISNEWLIDSIFVNMKSSVDWKSKPLSEIIKTAWVEFGTLVDMESIQTKEDVEKWIAQVLTPTTAGVGIWEWLHAKFESVRARFEGMTPSLVAKLSSLPSETIPEDYIKTLEPGEQKFVRNTLVPFREQFRAMTANSAVNAGMPELTAILFSEDKWIKMSELLAVFIRTGGHTDFESMNAFEHMSLYQSLFALLWSRDQQKAAAYMTALMNSSEKLPPHVQKLISVISGKSEQMILGTIATALNVSVWVFEKLTPEQKTGVVVAGAILLFAGRALLFTSLVAKVLAGVALITGVLTATATASTQEKEK